MFTIRNEFLIPSELSIMRLRQELTAHASANLKHVDVYKQKSINGRNERGFAGILRIDDYNARVAHSPAAGPPLDDDNNDDGLDTPPPTKKKKV